MKRSLHRLKSLFVPDSLADLLSDLGPGFALAQDVGREVDYLLIGERAGAFVLQHVSQGGSVTWEEENPFINGQPLDAALMVRPASGSDWLRERIKEALNLTVWVTPVVVFSRAQVQPGPPLQRVQLVDREHLVPLLKMPRSANPANALLWEGRDQLLRSLSKKG